MLLSLRVLRCSTSPLSLTTAYVLRGGFSGISQRGFPHSDIPGSKLICSSPGLIAAYRVLHRLLVPRHSPYTLSSLTIRNSAYACQGFASRARVSYMHTACVWSEKTTVCRIFSCQRTRTTLVENTVLQPLTSCLQTRRSPS